MGVIIESLGWFGAVTILGGYLLFSAGKLPNGVLYQVVNLVGALAITVNVLAHHAWPSTIVNSIWAVIAAVVLVRMRIARKRGASSPGRTGATSPEAHVELPTTTLVLPVIGPSVRDREAMAERWAAEDPTTPAEALSAVPADHETGAPDPAGTAPSLQTGSLTMADVPVVTAAIAVAIIAAARDGASRDEAARDEAARDETARGRAARDETARDEPQRSVDALESTER